MRSKVRFGLVAEYQAAMKSHSQKHFGKERPADASRNYILPRASRNYTDVVALLLSNGIINLNVGDLRVCTFTCVSLMPRLINYP